MLVCNVSSFMMIDHATGFHGYWPLLGVTFNQLPQPAVCAVAVKRKKVPVLTRVTVCASGLEPTGIVKLTPGNYRNVE